LQPDIAMADKPDPDKLTGPGGIPMRQLHELVKKSAARDLAATKPQNKLAQKTSRWQRVARYMWDKKKG
jgi:hypothetical protein